ncbi:hypothetical protein [Bdellovibrio sp. HCB209]|uniref:hypothetical protein n=1 Tax=Bdellovibrio sp. HCB209 TaxID=3394354 RepID=UPI0039B5B58F
MTKFSFLISIFFAFNVSAAELPDFLKNPFAATITSTLVTPASNSSFVRGSVTVLPSRHNVPLMEKVAQFNYNFRLRLDSSAPMVFIVPGTGGTAESAGALVVAEQLFAMGYHVVTVDNPFSWKFAVAGSKSGLPGYTPRDSQDLYSALIKVKKSLSKDYGVKPREFSLVGYSIGGLQSLFVKKIDDEQGAFSFSKVLVINPPPNLLHAINKLDILADLDKKLSKNQKQNISFKVLQVTDLVLGKKVDLNNGADVDRVFKQMKFNDTEMAYLIGQSFRDSLGDLVFSTQQVNDLGILKSKVTKYKRNARNYESRAVPFVGYMENFLYPQIKKSRGADFSVEDLNNESSIFQFADYIRANDNLFLIDSADDLFTKPSDIAWMQSQFGDRAMILPIGGHCGFFQLPAFKAQVKRIFQR